MWIHNGTVSYCRTQSLHRLKLCPCQLPVTDKIKAQMVKDSWKEGGKQSRFLKIDCFVVCCVMFICRSVGTRQQDDQDVMTAPHLEHLSTQVSMNVSVFKPSMNYCSSTNLHGQKNAVLDHRLISAAAKETWLTVFDQSNPHTAGLKCGLPCLCRLVELISCIPGFY